MRRKPFRRVSSAAENFEAGAQITLIEGDSLEVLKRFPDSSVDLIFSSPPYCIGKSYESTRSAVDFVRTHTAIVPELLRLLKPGGSLCWQVGYHVQRGALIPLDFLVHQEVSKDAAMHLRNRIIWTFNHGLHAKKRFSGRHETILWYTKKEGVQFALDAVRVPQRYPGKLHYKGPNKGKLSGNPLGKNPGDVWDIPNVKGKHVEKTEHPCQFPVALPQRFIKAACPAEGIVLDPFMGVGSTGVAAALEGRRFVGVEIDGGYAEVAAQRVNDAIRGVLQVRPIDRPTLVPDGKSKVSRRPAHFRG